MLHYLCPVKNVGKIERIASGVLGAALLVFGLNHRKLPGYLAAAGGLALIYRGLSGNCKYYQVMGVTTVKPPRRGRISVPGNRGVKVEQMIVVNRPASEVYKAWRNFANLPNFMSHLESVQEIDARRSFWKARGLAGKQVSWEAEIINEKPDEMIAWRSLEGADVDNAGTVRFRPVVGGTEVRVSLEYDPAGGRLGAAVARLFNRDPSREIEEDLVRFKGILESAG